MAKKFGFQKNETIPLLAAGPVVLALVPKGFHGYVRVKFFSGTGTDQMLGMWVPINSELQPVGVTRLNATNSSLMWIVGEEKLWEMPSDEMALIAFVTNAGGYAFVDCAGEVQEQ